MRFRCRASSSSRVEMGEENQWRERERGVKREIKRGKLKEGFWFWDSSRCGLQKSGRTCGNSNFKKFH